MYQIYLLSVVTITLAGIALAFERLDRTLRIGSLFNSEVFSRPTFRLVVGLVTLLVGFFQFLTVAPDDIPVVGDLVPAVAGIVLGGTLLVQYYGEKSTVDSGFMQRLDQIFVRNASNLGVVGLVVALLHFLFHRVLLL